MTNFTESHYGVAFEEFIAILLSYKYPVEVIYSDADGAVIANLNKHGTVRIEACAAGDHVDEAETRINPVKERFRSIKAGLDFPMIRQVIIELVHYVVGRINIGISQYSLDGLCPRVRFTEQLIDAEKELRVGFGHLVVARNKNVVSNDAMKVKGEVCLTLRPVGNRQGSWRMLKLVNGKIVSRSQFKEVPMTDLAKMRLEELALIEGNGQIVGSDDDVDYDEPEDMEYDNLFNETKLEDVTLDFPMSANIINGVSSQEQRIEPDKAQEDARDGDLPVLSNDDSDGDESELVIEIDSKSVEDATVKSDSPRRDVSRFKDKPRKYWNRKTHTWDSYIGSGIFHVTPKVGRKRYGVLNSLKSIYKEIKSLYDNGTFEGVLPEKIDRAKKRKIIRSFIIQNEKFNAEGVFEKLKSRLVVSANGSSYIHRYKVSYSWSSDVVYYVCYKCQRRA